MNDDLDVTDVGTALTTTLPSVVDIRFETEAVAPDLAAMAVRDVTYESEAVALDLATTPV